MGSGPRTSSGSMFASAPDAPPVVVVRRRRSGRFVTVAVTRRYGFAPVCAYVCDSPVPHDRFVHGWAELLGLRLMLCRGSVAGSR